MNTIAKTSLAVWQFVVNKLVAILILIGLTHLYKNLPADRPTAFAELLYAVILISAVTILAPFMRLLVFPEVAVYAEGDSLRIDLTSGRFRPALIHYWFATLICYLTTLLCVSSLLSH